MISSFRIGNFKAFEYIQKIPIKPITLIYGPNSGGKSSIIHALMLAQHAQATGRLDIHSTDKGGDSIDLGGFRQYIHKHNISGHVDLSLDVRTGPKRPDVNTIDISIQLPLDDKGVPSENEDPDIIYYSISRSGKTLIKFSKRPDRTYVVDMADPSILSNKVRSEFFDNERGRKIMEFTRDDLLKAMPELSFQRDGLTLYPRDIQDLLQKLFSPANKANKPTGSEQRLRNEYKLFILLDAINRILIPLNKSLSAFSGSVAYLGPVRAYPSRHIAGSRYNDPNWYAGGGYAWDIVVKKKEVRDKINIWLTSSERLQKHYSLNINEYIGTGDVETIFNEGLSDIYGNYEEYMSRSGITEEQGISLDIEKDAGHLSEILKRSSRDKIFELRMRDMETDTLVTHRDVGFGISQVLPVLAYSYAYNETIIAIEQPEIHLHPAIQADLSDVFIESALGKNKNKFLIETHSEHILLRIMRRMRQTAEGTLPKGLPELCPEQVAVLYVQPMGSSSIVVEIPINKKGELIKAWPGGFFEESLREIF